MSLSKQFILFLILVLSFSIHTSAEEVQKKTSQSIKRKRMNAKPVQQSNWEFGAGYIQWNEKLTLTRGSTSSEGYSGYAGPFIIIEKNFLNLKSIWGISTFLGFGQAASSGFQGSITFDDGINKSWIITGVQSYYHYRFNNIYSAGVGAVAKYRQINWEPADQTISVEAESPTAFAGQMSLRLALWNKVSFWQTYTVLDTVGHSQWAWSAQYIF